MINKENLGANYGIEFQGGAGDGYNFKRGRIFPEHQEIDPTKQIRDDEYSEHA